MEKLIELNRIDGSILPQATAGAVTGAVYLDMSEFSQAMILVTATLGVGESVSCQAVEATDAAGTGITALGAAIVLDTDGVGIINVDTASMTEGSEFLSVTMTSTGTTEIQATIVRSNARYRAVTQDVDASVVI